MAHTVDSLTVWEIAFRWNNKDPDIYWFQRIPLEVKDSIRMMMDALRDSALVSICLNMEKRAPDSDVPKEFFYRTHLDDIESMIYAKSFKRRLLRFVYIERYDLYHWCKEHNIPLPEFWFPEWDLPNWKDSSEGAEKEDAEKSDSPIKGMKPVTRHRITSQEIAKVLWKESPTMPIDEMAAQDPIQRYGHGANYTTEAVHGWLKEVLPDSAKRPPGRPKKDA